MKEFVIGATGYALKCDVIVNVANPYHSYVVFTVPGRYWMNSYSL